MKPCEKCQEPSTKLTRVIDPIGFAGELYVCEDCRSYYKWCFECSEWRKPAEFLKGSYVCHVCTAEIAAEREKERVTV